MSKGILIQTSLKFSARIIKLQQYLIKQLIPYWQNSIRVIKYEHKFKCKIRCCIKWNDKSNKNWIYNLGGGSCEKRTN